MTQGNLLEFVARPGIKARFDGAVYSPGDDDERLHGLSARVKWLMADRQWRSQSKIQAELGILNPESVGATLRNFRKPRNGGYVLERRVVGDRKRGLFEYRLLPPSHESCQAERDQLLKQIEKANRALRRAVARLEKLEAGQ